MDTEEDNKTTAELYPSPTKGPLSEDHSDYGTQKTWAGGDPDKSNRAYFIGFLVVMGILFMIAVKSLSGGSFFF